MKTQNGLMSMPMARAPSNDASIGTVPEPIIGSSTVWPAPTPIALRMPRTIYG
jgi:hypothetical protein